VLRGIRLANAATILPKLEDLRRFDNARQFMGCLGLVPGKRLTGETVRGSRPSAVSLTERLAVADRRGRPEAVNPP
jgi:transposase